MGAGIRRVTGTGLAVLLAGAPFAPAQGQTPRTSEPLIPAEGGTGAWIGALTGGVVSGTLVALLVHGICETDDCPVGLAFVYGAVAGGSAGAFLGQVTGTAIATAHRMQPAGWLQAGIVRGTNGSDRGSTGGGARVALLGRMNPWLAAGVEVARHGSPVATHVVSCFQGCAPGLPAERAVRVTGSITSVALVERLDVPLWSGADGHVVVGLGWARKTANWTFVDGLPRWSNTVPTPPTEETLHVTAGAGFGIRLGAGLRATVEFRWEPAWGTETFGASVGLSYR